MEYVIWTETLTLSLVVILIIVVLVSKVTLDIICEAAFGYEADSLHNPCNELAEAYELLLGLQSGNKFTRFCRSVVGLIYSLGPNLARFILLVPLPGMPRFLYSDWAYHHRHWLGKIPFLCESKFLLQMHLYGISNRVSSCHKLVDAMYRIRKISAHMLE